MEKLANVILLEINISTGQQKQLMVTSDNTDLMLPVPTDQSIQQETGQQVILVASDASQSEELLHSTFGNDNNIEVNMYDMSSET